MKQKKFTKDTVRYTAKLARMSLSEKETGLLAGQLGDILSYVEKLNKVNTDEVIPTSHVHAVKNIFRADEVRPSLKPDEATKNAPEKRDNFFVVPKIIE